MIFQHHTGLDEIVTLDSDDEGDDDVEITKIYMLPPVENERKYYAKRSKRVNFIGPWQSCNVIKEFDIESNSDIVYNVEFSDEVKEFVASYELAANIVPEHADLALGTRVIARRRDEYLPYILNENNEKTILYANGNEDFFPGILIRFYMDRYLVFFDDGISQYVPREYLRRVNGNDTYKHAHWNAKSYFEFMCNVDHFKYAPEVNDMVSIELNGKWKRTQVLKNYGGLLYVHFKTEKRFEWIYCSSPRIWHIFRKLMVMRMGKILLDGLTGLRMYKTCLAPYNGINFSNEIIPKKENKRKLNGNIADTVLKEKQDDKSHVHGPMCLCSNEKNIEKYDALQRPMMTGWKRIGQNKKYYRVPCGARMYSYREVNEYLTETESKLRMDCFEFDPNIDIPNTWQDFTPKTDISNGLEPIPVPVREPITLTFNYITGYNFDYIGTEPENNLGRIGCDCTDNCRNKMTCSCWLMTALQEMKQTSFTKSELAKYSNRIGYINMKLLKSVKSGIFECGSQCGCCSDRCENRVVQHGQQHELEVFKTKHKGWGVKTKFDLPEGAFVSHYAGALLEQTSADKINFAYQFRLPTNTANTDDNHENSFESDFNSEDVPSIKRPYIDYDEYERPRFMNFIPIFNNGNADNYPVSDYVGKCEQIIIDASTFGNVSRFLNHSCGPNLFTQMVYVSDDKRFPVVAFFTSRIIKAGEELTFDYNYELNDNKKTRCYCNAPNCRKRLM